MDGLSVSVVIPTHDRRRLLERALASVAAQSLAPREVIVVDDGSTDGTSGALRRRHPDVIAIEQAHYGVSAARNRGISASTAEWIAFLDSDDEWHPEKLARQAAAVAASPGSRVCHTDEVWIHNGRRRNPMAKHAKRGGWIFESCLPLCCISPSSVMIHRAVFELVGTFDESLPACEDYDLWLRVACRYPVTFVGEALVTKYGGHEDQLSRRHWGMDRFRIRALEKILRDDHLSASQRRAAMRVASEKIEIYRAGAAKRGKTEETERYAAKLRHLRASAPDGTTPSPT